MKTTRHPNYGKPIVPKALNAFGVLEAPPDEFTGNHMTAAQRYRARHKLAGLCLQCSEPVKPGGLKCTKHAADAVARATAWQKRRAEQWRLMDWWQRQAELEKRAAKQEAKRARKMGLL